MGKLKEYQDFCKKNHSPNIKDNPLYFTTGLAGEVGEVCEIIKKSHRDACKPDKEALVKELGDVLWYLTNIATLYGITLKEAIEKNIEKLTARHGGEYKPHVSDSEVAAHLAACGPVTHVFPGCTPAECSCNCAKEDTNG